MTANELLMLLTVAQALVESGKSSFAAIKGALVAQGATPEDFDAAEAKLQEIIARRRAQG